jgi:hypothetical protein
VIAGLFVVRMVNFAAILALLAPTYAEAVPPPPIATHRGPTPLCAARYGVRLAGNERAEQYARDIWVLSGPGYQIGMRSDLGRLEGQTTRVAVPGLPVGERQRVREYPGNRYRGWVYAFPLPDGVTLRVASDQFAGTDADRAMLGRVLVGTAREALCAPDAR